MNLRLLLAAGALSLNAAAVAAPASGTAAPAAAPLPQGPAIPGYCVFSLNAIIGSSKVGQAVVARLKILGSQVNAELQPEADQIRTEERTLESQTATLDAATLQSRRQSLGVRAADFEKREQLRQQEMQATQNKQFGVVLHELDPVMRDLYGAHRCSILVDGDQGGVKIVNPEMDLSRQAVVGLDARIQTLTFDREHLDTPGAAAAAAR